MLISLLSMPVHSGYLSLLFFKRFL